MSARQQWRQCPSCAGRCKWVEPAWWCSRCGLEFTQADDPKFAPPGGKVVELATCSYSEFSADMGLGVRISLGTPRWIRRETPWPYVPELAPSRTYMNTPDESVFIDRYLAQLRSVGTERIRLAFRTLAQQHKAERLVLLCFEKLPKGEPCHRRYFAAWWQTSTGQEVAELGAMPDTEQLDLLEGLL